jgi:hypothetical protein
MEDNGEPIVNDIPKDAYTTAGNRIVVVVPSHDLVIVRRGLDYGTRVQ